MVRADQASVSLLRGEGAGVFVHPRVEAVQAGREPVARVLAAGSPEYSERVRFTPGQGPGTRRGGGGSGGGSASSL